MKKIIFILFIGYYIGIAAQPSTTSSTETAHLPKIVPPSPTAYALGNYGNVPIGHFTGSLNLQVPLIEFNSADIKVPIYLFYGSNGIKVDDVSGNVGIGWNMHFGGIITKTVRDLDDDLQLTVPTPDNFTPGYINNSIINAFYYNAGNELADTERDLYSFNFNGYSGKFILDEGDNPILISQEYLVIKRESNSGFSITTKEGATYYFTDAEKTSFRMIGNGFSQPMKYHTTAWHLSKIINYKGNEVYFSYTNSGLTYDSSKSRTLQIYYPSPQTGCNGGLLSSTPNIGNELTQKISIQGKKINKIFSNNPDDGEINFTYEDNADAEGYFKVSSIKKHNKILETIENVDFLYHSTDKGRIFLNNISFKDPNRKYGFEYINEEIFPERLSYAQDHWGYFNGKTENVTVLPEKIEFDGLENLNFQGANKEPDWNFAQSGLLKRIIYPTRGFTDIKYEGNDYYGAKITPPPLKEHHLSITTLNNHSASTSVEIPVQTNHWMKISGISFFNIDCSGNPGEGGETHYPSTVNVFDENNEQVTLWQYNTNFSNYTPAYNNDFLEDGRVYYIAATAGKKYKIVLSTLRRCTSAYCDIYYLDGKEEVSHENLPTGGVRVKSVEDFTSQGISSDIKRYYYNMDNTLSTSSGDVGYSPVYYDLQNVRTKCTDTGMFAENTVLTVSSSSMIPLFNSGNSSCYYSDVYISQGGDHFEKGGEHKQYKVHRDQQGSLIFGQYKLQNTPWTNLSWDNGLELSSLIFDNAKVPVKEVVSNYHVNNTSTKVIKSFGVRKNYDEIIGTGFTHYCTQYETQNYPINLCFGRTPGYPVTLPMFTNLDIMQYSNISTWHYLESQANTEYLNGIPVATVTDYFYNNPSHYQLTGQKTTFPDGSSRSSSFGYAHEKGNQKLIAANMVGIPLLTETTKTSNGTTKTVSKTETVFPDQGNYPTSQAGSLLLPLYVKSYRLENNSPAATEITYDRYDDRGNLLQYTTKDGVPTTIIWGYGKTQPIAKIVGAGYPTPDAKTGEIPQSLVTVIVDASDIDAALPKNSDESVLLAALDGFRNDARLKDYQVTTYTYDPLLGVRSITPPSGIREYYVYDDANRLKEVRDADGKILKSYEYHYKP